MVGDTLEEFMETMQAHVPKYDDVPLYEREYKPACLIRKAEKQGEPVYFRVKDSPLLLVSAVLTSRRDLTRLFNTDDLSTAYNELSRIREYSETIETNEHSWAEYRETEDISTLPWIKFYEKDGGYYLTSSIVSVCINGVCNASIHRIMLSPQGSILIRLVPRHLYRLAKEYTGKGYSLPVTIVMGVHPLHTLAAATSPPLGVYELAYSARKLSSKLYKSPLHGNPVPKANIIVEARITPELGREGPFVDAMGTYDRVREQHVLEIERIYYKPGGMAHIILPGGKEHALLMGFPREAEIYASVSRVVPKVHKVALTPASGGWLHAVISISKNTDGDAKNAIMAAFAGHPSLKHVVIVDDDIDPDDPYQVEWAIATRFQASKDLVVINNARGSTLDPSAKDGVTSKMGLDATKPLHAGETFEKAGIPGCSD